MHDRKMWALAAALACALPSVGQAQPSAELEERGFSIDV